MGSAQLNPVKPKATTKKFQKHCSYVESIILIAARNDFANRTAN